MKPILVVLIVLFASYTALGQSKTQENSGAQVATRVGLTPIPRSSSSGSDVFALVVPFKEEFVVRELEPTALGLIAQCASGATHDGKIEILEGPGFVGIGNAIGRTADGDTVAIGIISPLRGDAGNYSVKLSLGSCDGGPEKVLTFKVKVKKSKGER